MKTILVAAILSAVLAFVANQSQAQNGQKWSIAGNSAGANDFLGTTNYAPLVFKTNNISRLTFDADGNMVLNIFAQNPAGLLAVDAGGKVKQVAYSNNSNDVLAGDGSFRDINSFSINKEWKMTGNVLFVDPGWKIGIGISNPAAPLDVNGDAIVRGTLHVYDGIIIGKTYTGEKATLDTVEASKMQAEEMKAEQYKTNTIAIDGVMSSIISNTGQISFGYNNLDANSISVNDLYVSGTVTQQNLTVVDQLQIGYSSLHLKSVDLGSITDNRIYTTNGDLLIQSETGSTFNTIINANNSGFVGIGTITPQTNLHIKGSTDLTSYDQAQDDNPTASLSAIIRLEDVAYDAPPAYSSMNRTAHWDIAASAGRKGLYFVTDDGWGGTSQHIVMVLKESTGNVGIGVTNPSEKLHVMGTDFPVFAKIQNNIGYTKIGFNGSHGIIESDHGLLLNYYSGQDVIVGGQTAGQGSFYSVHNTYLATNDGQVAIGCSQFDPGAMLTVKGKITTEDVEVKQLNYPDYVFATEYKLLTFDELRAYIEQNKHLPNVPSASEVTENGLSLSDNSRVQMEKIEELTLYILQLEQRMKELEAIINAGIKE